MLAGHEQRRLTLATLLPHEATGSALIYQYTSEMKITHRDSRSCSRRRRDRCSLHFTSGSIIERKTGLPKFLLLAPVLATHADLFQDPAKTLAMLIPTCTMDTAPPTGLSRLRWTRAYSSMLFHRQQIRHLRSKFFLPPQDWHLAMCRAYRMPGPSLYMAVRTALS